jgi:Tol biopolymer transport system component
LAPAVSPDGTTLAFKREVAYALADIYVLPADGRSKDRTPRRITTEPRPAVGSLAWTPDSRGLVFYSPRSGEPALWQISGDARSRPVLVTGTAHIGSDFALSAQGRLVYCTQNASYHLWRISLGRGIAGPATAVLPVTGRSDWLPQYSPDGKRIAFASNRSGNDEIWVCNEDGSALMPVTSLAAFSGTPRWSPDGAKIAFDSNKTGNWDIFVVGSQGGKPLQLTTNRSDDYVPSWSRDGQWVYFASRRTGSTEIWKIAPTGGREVQVTRNGGFNALEAPSGKQLYFTKHLGEGSVWRIALPDGAEEPVGGRLLGRAFEPAVRGLYLVEETSGRTMLKFREYGSSSETAVATLGRGHVGAMTISPDERTAVYELLDVANSELMLVESFRRKRSGFRW